MKTSHVISDPGLQVLEQDTNRYSCANEYRRAAEDFGVRDDVGRFHDDAPEGDLGTSLVQGRFSFSCSR